MLSKRPGGPLPNPTWTLLATALLCAAPAARAQTAAAKPTDPASATAPAELAAKAGQGQADDDDDVSDEEETAEGKAELEELRKAELKAGFLAPEAHGHEQLSIGLGELHPFAQDLG